MHAYKSLSKSGIYCFLFVYIEVQITICQMTKITILFIICFKIYSLFTPNCKHAIISGMSSWHEEHLYKLEEKHGGGERGLLCCML